METMVVKTVLNLEADSRGLCQDSVADAKQMGNNDAKENLYSILLQGGENASCSDRSLDRVYRITFWAVHFRVLRFTMSSQKFTSYPWKISSYDQDYP